MFGSEGGGIEPHRALTRLTAYKAASTPNGLHPPTAASVRRLHMLRRILLISKESKRFCLFCIALAVLTYTPSIFSQTAPSESKIPPVPTNRIVVQVSANYQTQGSCILVVSGTGNSHNVCPRSETAAVSHPKVPSSVRPCDIYRGTAEASNSLTTYCDDVALEIPEWGGVSPAVKVPTAGTDAVKRPITSPVRANKTGPPL